MMKVRQMPARPSTSARILLPTSRFEGLGQFRQRLIMPTHSIQEFTESQASETGVILGDGLLIKISGPCGLACIAPQFRLFQQRK